MSDVHGQSVGTDEAVGDVDEQTSSSQPTKLQQKLELQGLPGPNAPRSASGSGRKPLTKSELDDRWNASAESTKATKTRRHTRIAAIVLTCLAVLCAIGTFAYWERHNWDPFFGYMVSCYLFLGGIFSLGIGSSNFGSARKKFDEQEELVWRAANFERAVDAVENKLSLDYVSGINTLLMNSYHDVTKTQAERSFRHSQRAMIAGLSLIIGGGIVAIAPTSPSTKIAVAGLAAIGSLVSGYIGKTFLASHAAAILQLNRFFEQPLVNSYLLNAERISATLSPNSRDKVMIAVVQESIAAARLVLSEGGTKDLRRAGSRKRLEVRRTPDAGTLEKMQGEPETVSTNGSPRVEAL